MRAVGNIIVHHFFAHALVNNPDLARSADNDLTITPIRRLATYCTYVFKFKLSVEFRNDLRFGSNIGSGTTHVEGTKSQLRTRFSNGLRCDHPNRFADLAQLSGRTVTTVAPGAGATLRFTGQYRPALQQFNSRPFEPTSPEPI